MALVHKHLIVRAEVDFPPGPNEFTAMQIWISNLVYQLGMNIMRGPEAVYCHMKGNRGMTGFAIIETSHIAFHSWDEQSPSIIQLDVYSCSEFAIETVVNALQRFQPTKIEYKFLDRDVALIELEHETDHITKVKP
jgi:S-adenosylmethionine/arginine decarboxylase-like enzyme